MLKVCYSPIFFPKLSSFKDWMLPSTQNDVFDQMTAPVEHKHLRCNKQLQESNKTRWKFAAINQKPTNSSQQFLLFEQKGGVYGDAKTPCCPTWKHWSQGPWLCMKFQRPSWYRHTWGGITWYQALKFFTIIIIIIIIIIKDVWCIVDNSGYFWSLIVVIAGIHAQKNMAESFHHPFKKSRSAFNGNPWEKLGNVNPSNRFTTED